MLETFRTPPAPVEIDPQIEALEHQLAVTAFEVGHTALAVNVVESRESFVLPPEAQVRAVAESLWTSHSPFNTENTPYFGGEFERIAAAETVTSIADQSRLTGKYLDGRHKALTRQFDAGDITKVEHDEAVGGILTGFALTNPAHLSAVNEAQAKVITRRVAAGMLPENTQVVALNSYVTEDGSKLAGIDMVVASMTGRTSQAEVAMHGLEMKAQYYGPENMLKANRRHQKRQEELFRAALAAETERRFIIDLLDREGFQKKHKEDDE
jgi:hypothetical protein